MKEPEGLVTPKRRSLRWLGTVLLLLGALLLLGYAYKSLAVRRAQLEGLRGLEQTEHPGVVARPPAGSAVAHILVPEVGVDVVAFEGVDPVTLGRGAGHFPGTPLPGQRGNVSFAAHRDSFFRGLREIELEDEVVVVTEHGRFRYRVNDLQVVEPTRVDVVKSRGRDELTLITCYPFDYVGPAPRRFVVHAALEERVSGSKPAGGLDQADFR